MQSIFLIVALLILLCRPSSQLTVPRNKMSSKTTRRLFGVASTGEADSRALNQQTQSEFDVIVIGSGIGGLCAANLLKHVYKKSVCVFESHYLAGGELACSHVCSIRNLW